MHINLTIFRPAVTRFARSEKGVVAIVVALGLTMLMGFAALAIDVGMLYRERAQLQAQADVAALSAVPDFTESQTRVENSLQQNAQDVETLHTLELGRFLRNPAIPKEDRFTTLPNGTPGINAIVVALQDDAPLYFAQVFVDQDSARINVESTALRTGAASFSLGSHLARLNEASLSDALNQSLNAQIELSIGDIEIMQGISFQAGDFLDALRDQINFDNLNPAKILDQTVSPGEVIAALEAVSPAALPGSFSALAFSGAGEPLSVRDLISGSDVELGLTTMDFLSDMTLNAHEVVVSLARPGATGNASGLVAAASVSGVLDVDARISLGEPPAQSGTIAMGEIDVTLHSAAARVQTDVSLAPDLVGSLGVGVQTTRLNLPLFTELAGASATLTDLSCTGEDPSTLAASFVTSHSDLHPGNGTSVAALYLGVLPDNPMASTSAIDPADLGFADILDISITVKVPLLPDITLSNLTVQARSHVSVGQSQEEKVTFTKGDVETGRNVKNFGSGDLLQTAVQSLLSPDNLELRVKPGQSGLDDVLIQTALSNVLDALPTAILGGLVSPVDSVLGGTLSTLGVELGVGELTLTGHHCEVPQLVR